MYYKQVSLGMHVRVMVAVECSDGGELGVVKYKRDYRVYVEMDTLFTPTGRQRLNDYPADFLAPIGDELIRPELQFLLPQFQAFPFFFPFADDIRCGFSASCIRTSMQHDRKMLEWLVLHDTLENRAGHAQELALYTTMIAKLDHILEK